MIRFGTTRAAFAAATIGAIALAGCGSSSSSTSSTTASATTPSSTSSSSSAPSGGAATVGTANNSDLGQTILVDGKGMTLYLFEKDTGGKSACSGACASVWTPDVTNGTPKATGSLDAAKLGTTKRSDGTTQVTYANHPLYYYEDDQKPGDIEGKGSKEFGAEWYPVQPSGDTAEGKGSDESSDSS